MEAVKKKTNDIQRSQENNRGCASITPNVENRKDGSASGMAKQNK